MSQEDPLIQKIREIWDHYLLPPDPMETFSRLDGLIDELDIKYQALGQTFRHNLSSLLSSVGVPFSLAADAGPVSFDARDIAKWTRARTIELDAVQPGEWLETFLIREALRKAGVGTEDLTNSERLRDVEFKVVQEVNSMSLAIEDIWSILARSYTSEKWKLAARELIQQGIILTWSAFEVLCRDAFELELNLYPSKAALLAQNLTTRKRFEFEKVSLDILIKHEFDLSAKMGTYLVSRRDFSDLPTIKSVYLVLFASSDELASHLNHPELWLLYQRRHLFVHRRGIVDQNYLDNTSDATPLGSTLEVSPKDFEEQFQRVLETGETLLRCLQEQGTPS